MLVVVQVFLVMLIEKVVVRVWVVVEVSDEVMIVPVELFKVDVLVFDVEMIEV